ncbi:HGGxSTG domain-containing protein [Actinomyces naeslundii]
MSSNPTPSAGSSEPHATPTICGAKTRSGKPCQQHPIRGGTRCRMHGGSTPRALAKANRRTLEARVQGELAKREIEPITDPVAAYADLVGETWTFKELAREKIAELRAWTTVNVITGTDEAAAILQVYERSLDRAQRSLADMLRIGLTAEHLRQARERPTLDQAKAFQRVLEHILDQLQLADTQRALVPQALAAALTQEGLL